MTYRIMLFEAVFLFRLDLPKAENDTLRSVRQGYTFWPNPDPRPKSPSPYSTLVSLVKPFLLFNILSLPHSRLNLLSHSHPTTLSRFSLTSSLCIKDSPMNNLLSMTVRNGPTQLFEPSSYPTFRKPLGVHKGIVQLTA